MPQLQDEIIMLLLTMLSVLLLTLVCGYFGLKLVRRLQLGQTVREDGPKSHYVKSGTPTFGGLFFLLPVVAVTFTAGLLLDLAAPVISLLLLTITFGLTGFLDDYIKVKIDKKGLSVKQKSLLMLVFSILFAVYYLYFSPQTPFFRMPLSGTQYEITGWLKLPYLAFTVLYLFFISNSVNLTDGVDGLASSVTFINALTLALISLALASTIPEAAAGWLLAAAVAGGCLGFLFYNRHPAQVFMGDTGSQALGAALAGIALILGMPWLMLPAGLIYIAESLSVMLQVAYFKKTGGKRIFRMSPIHHHYELGGWSEQKIVLVFSAVSVVGCLAAWLLAV